MKDIFKLLGYNNSRKAVQEYQVENKYKKKYKYITLYPTSIFIKDLFDKLTSRLDIQ